MHAFVRAVGYPIILKPRTGAGALDTARVDSDGELAAALGSMGSAESIAVEEFVEGHEGFYDTLSVDGRPALDFVSHYFPNVLEAMRTRWISPQFVATNRVDTEPDYRQLKELGLRVNEALGIGTSATHMEWFFGPKGLRFSEIGCRPPGVGAWDLYSAGNEIDIYRAWADAIVHGEVWHVPTRAVRGRHRRAAAGAGRHDHRLLRRRRGAGPARRVGASTRTCRRPAPRPSRSPPATWPTRTCGCGTRTTTCCAGCWTTSGAPCTCTPADRPVPITILGPQRRPTVPRPASGRAPVATVTAGWQERESDDAELDRVLGGGTVNLRLHARWLEVLDADEELATAELNHRAVLDELQELYALQVEHAERAADAVRRSGSRPRTRAAALADAESALRLLDDPAPGPGGRRPGGLRRRPGGRRERDAVARHRAEVAEQVAGAAALVVTGGHVGVLLHVLRLFAVLAARRRRRCWPGRPGRWR